MRVVQACNLDKIHCKRRKSSLVKEFHQTATISLAILETIGCRKFNLELIGDMDYSNACMQFERNSWKKGENHCISNNFLKIWGKENVGKIENGC